jgi:hypothetical protein
MNRFSLIIAAASLSACSQSPSAVRITNDVPTPKKMPERVAIASRSEPVFYNGKTYQVNIAPLASGTYTVAIAGMSAGQQKDATGLSTSAFHHFTCKDSQKTNILTKPAYAGGQWALTAKCG